ncbi:hypothetical protein DL98DRAFT_638808 [Cadophora sp. DSE1049]|nr:hypothetical protein DL98DRAFT_638808 [Cadophora sp. DSE1049]
MADPDDLMPLHDSHSSDVIDLHEPQPRDNRFNFPDGDVTILVTSEDGEIIKGKVFSHAMLLAGQHWKSFITPPQSEGEPIELDHLEDDPSALLFILNIVHWQPDKNPKAVSFDTLFNIAILCDNYVCLHVVGPSVQDLNSEWLEDPAVMNQEMREKALYIAFVFGREDTFRRIAEHMVLVASLNADGTLRAHDESLDLYPLPDDILSKRDHCIAKLLALSRSIIKGFRDPVTIQCRSGNKKCDQTILTELLKRLEMLGLDFLPEDKASDTVCSPSLLAGRLSRIKIGIPPTSVLGSQEDHSRCGVSYEEQVNKIILNDIEDPTDDNFVGQMEYRRRALDGAGLLWTDYS